MRPNRPNSAERRRQRTIVFVLLLPALITAFFWVTSWNEVSTEQGILAFLLLAFPCWLYTDWRENGRFQLPLLALIGAMYWLFFAVPAFWGDRIIPDWRYY